MTTVGKDRFAELVRSLNTLDLAEKTMVDDLVGAYSEEHRHYHTLQHINECIQLFDDYLAAAKHVVEDRDFYEWERQAMELAIWWHDIVYCIPAPYLGNEYLSACHARYEIITHMMIPQQRRFIILCKDLILATETHGSGSFRSHSSDIVNDIDMAILGASPDRFAQYEQQIQQEYSQYPAEAYRAGRLSFLKGLSSKPRIFATDYFADRFEEAAKRNIAELINQLNSKL